jgi:hypothetical protein
MTYSPDKVIVGYNFHYSDGKLFPQPLAVVFPWEVPDLDLEGTTITENGQVRIIAAGPNEEGWIVFEDGGEAWLGCKVFKGQDTPEGKDEVYKKDLAARKESDLIIPVR